MSQDSVMFGCNEGIAHGLYDNDFTLFQISN